MTCQVYAIVHWTSHFFQGSRNTGPCLTGHSVFSYRYVDPARHELGRLLREVLHHLREHLRRGRYSVIPFNIKRFTQI